MSILVIAEHDHNSLADATLKTLSAAAALGEDIHVLVAGENCASAADAAAACAGVTKVLCADNAAYAHFIAENMAALAAEMAGGYSYVLTPATTFGKNILPRLGALLDVQPVSDITGIESADTFTRPVYAGNAMATVQLHDDVKLISVRPTAFGAVAGGGSAAVEQLSAVHNSDLVEFVGLEQSKSERPELGSAKVVVSGGRGLQSAENFKLVEELADKLGAALGASRAAVDAGWVPNDWQVGQTGKVVAPELYIAVGISGAIQHLAGMKDAKTIVAINKDENAPIFDIATYGLVADLFEAVPELVSALDGAGVKAA